MRAAVLVNDSLYGDWINKFEAIFNSSDIDTYVFSSERKTFVFKFFLKMNQLIFGKSKLVKECNLQSDLELEEKLKTTNYDIVVNLTGKKYHFNYKDTNKYDIYICENNNLINSIVYYTANKCSFVNINFSNNGKHLTTKSVRFDELSISHNIDLVIHSILSVFKNLEGLQTSKHDTKQSIKITSIGLNCLFSFFQNLLTKIYYRTFYREQWVIGYKFSNKSLADTDLNDLVKIIPPKDRFWADPVLVSHKGKNYIFIEELIYKEKHAYLSVFELKENGGYTKPKAILKKPYHLSYPFVFEYNEVFYMIPETSNANNIQLYESKKFPYEWEFKEELLGNIKASDSTLLNYEGKWWLFTSVKEFQYSSYDNNLKVFYSDNLLGGTWVEHKKGFLKTDICNSRQAGGFINEQSNIYRVSQNCKNHYGYGFNIHRLNKLNELDFKESLIYEFEPYKGIKGIHTFNKSDSLILVDILINRRKI